MKRPGLAPAVGRVDTDQGLPMWTRLRSWVWSFLRQLGGHCRLLKEPRPPSVGELTWGELGDCLSEGMDMGFLRTSTAVFHLPKRSLSTQGGGSGWSGAGRRLCRHPCLESVTWCRCLVRACALTVQPEPRNSRRAEGHQRDQCARCRA